MTRKNIKCRIIDAIKEHGRAGYIQYHKLAELVFPESDFPNAWRKPNRGGPPGCYMVLTRALDRYGFYISLDMEGRGGPYRTVGLGQNN